MPTTASAVPPSPRTDRASERPAGAGSRIAALDVLRGFALCGILLVNIEPVTRFRYAVPHGLPTLADPSGWLQLAVQQRFFPIFSLLFGMGFSLFLASAAGRTPRPRVLLLRRLVVLLGFGALHQLIHPGEALLVYGVVGLIVLLPSSWLPRWAVAAAAAVVLPAGLLLVGGGFALVPGMFLLGSALVRYGVVGRIGASTRGPLTLFLVFAAASVPAVATQVAHLEQSDFDLTSAVAGLLMAGVYVTGMITLLQTLARSVLQAVFAPLGRMALTNYLTASLLMVLTAHLLGLPHSHSWALLFTLAAAILAVQWAWSTLWLRRYHQGPVEWAWRWVTWNTSPPLRTVSSRALTWSQ